MMFASVLSMPFRRMLSKRGFRIPDDAPVARRQSLSYESVCAAGGSKLIGLKGDLMLGNKTAVANVAVKNAALQCDIGYIGSQPRERAFKRALEEELDRLRTFLGL